MLLLMRTKLWWVVTLLLVIFFGLAVIGYINGYRISSNITIVKVQTLTITDIPENSSVFADYALRGKSSGGAFSLSLVPGDHLMLVTAQNHYPWTALITVPDNSNTKVRALVVPKEASGTLLYGKAREDALSLITNEKLPTPSKPLVLANGCALLSITDGTGTIVATPTTTPKCSPPKYLCINNSCATTIVYSQKNTPKAVIAYPNRQDAFLILSGKDLYAVSLDPRNPRTFVHMLHGIAPSIATLPNGNVVVSDQSSVYILNL